MKKIEQLPQQEVHNGAGSKGLFKMNTDSHNNTQRKIAELKSQQKFCVDRGEWNSIQHQIDELYATCGNTNDAE